MSGSLSDPRATLEKPRYPGEKQQNRVLEPLVTNVPAGTADVLSYTKLAVVAIFLASGPAIVYYYWRKNKKLKAAPAPPAWSLSAPSVFRA